jgi:dTDP-4-amino-4,6-dideoxygalactose transaminase
MVSSCSAALEIGATMCEIGPGDEVILPSFTFTSTANAFVRLGARPVFVEIRPDTLNLDENLVEAAITRRTKAIFPVHYAGVSCEMDCLLAIAAQHNLRVVEDAAQGVNSFYKGRALGTMGDFGAYSFHSTKDYTGGEGGTLCIRSPENAARAEIIRDKGTDRGRFLRGQADKYSWVDLGSSYTPSEISCAYLYAQLEGMDDIRERRRKIFELYRVLLAEYEENGWLRLPRIPAGCEPNYHMCYILLPDHGTRHRLMLHLRENGIQSLFHYLPLHCSPMGQQLGYRKGDLPVTEDLSGRLLRLPFYPTLRPQDQLRIAKCIQTFFTTVSAEVASRLTATSSGLGAA